MRSPIIPVCFLDAHNNICPDNHIVAKDDICSYCFNIPFNADVTIFCNNNTVSNKPTIKRNFASGIHPISEFNQILSTLIKLYGLNDSINYTIQLPEEKKLKIARYVYTLNFAELRGYEKYKISNSIILNKISGECTDNDNIELHAIALDSNNSSEYFCKDFKLNRLNNDESQQRIRYDISPLKECGERQFIIFSDNSCLKTPVQPYYLIQNEYSDEDVQKHHSIETITKDLLNDNPNTWKMLWFQIHLLIKYHLSWDTFHAFYAIAANPRLQARLILSLVDSPLQNRKNEYYHDETVIVMQLHRFEEEHGFDFHYIPKYIWDDEINRICDRNKYILAQFGISIPNNINRNFYFFEHVIEQSFSKNCSHNRIDIDNDHPILNVWKNHIPGNMNMNQLQHDRWPNYTDFIQNCKDLFDDSAFIIPPNYMPPTVEYYGKRNWNQMGKFGRVQMLIVILPQYAAKLAAASLHDADECEAFYDPKGNNYHSFERRFIHFLVSHYPEVYSELFFKALFRAFNRDTNVNKP